MNTSTSNKKPYTRPRLRKIDPLTEQNPLTLYGMELLARNALEDALRRTDSSQVAEVLQRMILRTMGELLNLRK